MKVNLNTVIKAYKELEIQDILQTRQGSGTHIGEAGAKVSEKERHGKLAGICGEFTTIAASYRFTIDHIIEELKRRI